MKVILLILFSLSIYTNAQTSSETTQSDIASGNLTDQDRQLLNTYQHSGYLQRDMKNKTQEVCDQKGLGERECQGIITGSDATDGKKFLGLSPGIVGALSKAYTMIIGIGGLGSKLEVNKGGEWNVNKLTDKVKGTDEPSQETAQEATQETAPEGEKVAQDNQTPEDPEAPENQEGEEKKEEQEDYCRYIAMGTETIATFMQSKEEETIASMSSSDQTAQADALYKQKNAHLGRARSVNTQVIGWGASTACYSAMMLGPASATSVTNWLKLGASTLLWRYYSWEKKTHKLAAATVQSVIDKLGKKGDCNPISDRACYCAQPETQDDQRFCLPQLRQGGVAGAYQISCLNDKLKLDPTCACASNNTCFDERMKAKLAQIHVPESLAANISPFFSAAKGVSKPGANEYEIDPNSNKLFATASGILNKNASKIGLPNTTLSKAKTNEANALKDFLPNSVARTFASAKAPQGTSSQASKFKAALSPSFAIPTKDNRVASKKMRLRGGQNLTPTNSKKSVSLARAKGSSTASQQVLKFAEKAKRSAQIYKDKSLNIFDVVSNRYRRTAKRRLETE